MTWYTERWECGADIAFLLGINLRLCGDDAILDNAILGINTWKCIIIGRWGNPNLQHVHCFQ